MLILNNVVEMTVDKNGKILDSELKPNMGLWLDTVNKAIANEKTETIQN